MALTLGDLSSLLQHMVDMWPSREVTAVGTDGEGRPTATLTLWDRDVTLLRDHDGRWRTA